ncbi:MAG: hypothetical protein WC676_05320 [Candidatus Omnitrophota bacterium]
MKNIFLRTTGLLLTIIFMFSLIIISSALAEPLGYVAYWYGKVNQHKMINGAWETDPDGVSGADIYPDLYCQKWFPDSLGVRDLGPQLIEGWKNQGNSGNYAGQGVVYECTTQAEAKITTPVVAWGTGFPTWKRPGEPTNPCDLEQQMLVQEKPWNGPHCENGVIVSQPKNSDEPVFIPRALDGSYKGSYDQ